MTVTVGIDLGIRKIALVVASGEEVIAGVVYESEATERANQLRAIAGFAHDQAQTHDATSVWIEDTIIGNNRKYSIQLSETKGAVMAALARLGIQVRLVDNKTWKKVVVGSGNATKPDVVDYIHVTYPAYALHCAEDQDLYDACCVAIYGRFIENQAHELHLTEEQGLQPG